MTDEPDEAELLHIAHAAYMLADRDAAPIWREESAAIFGIWRRTMLRGDWAKSLPLYLWITVRTA
jgi:hypothetical protein